MLPQLLQWATLGQKSSHRFPKRATGKYALALYIILCLCPECRDVQGNACSALVAIVKPAPKSAAEMLSAGAVVPIKRAMEAHLPLLAPGGM